MKLTRILNLVYVLSYWYFLLYFQALSEVLKLNPNVLIVAFLTRLGEFLSF